MLLTMLMFVLVSLATVMTLVFIGILLHSGKRDPHFLSAWLKIGLGACLIYPFAKLAEYAGQLFNKAAIAFWSR